MFNRHWRSILTTIGLTIILSVGGYFLYDWQIQRDSAYNAARKQYEESQYYVPLGKGKSSITDPDTRREEWRAEQDLDAQREMAKWTFYMLWTTIVGVVIASGGLIYVVRTFEVTRNSAERQLRAYVAPTKCNVILKSQQMTLDVAMILENKGLTPAHKCETFTVFSHGPEDQIDFSTLPEEPNSPTTDIAPGGSMTVTHPFTTNNTIIWNAIVSGQLPFFLHGEIRYLDTFDHASDRPLIRKTKYRLRYDPGSQQFTAHPKGNEMD